MSGFWVAYEDTYEPGAVATGDPEDEIRGSVVCGLVRGVALA